MPHTLDPLVPPTTGDPAALPLPRLLDRLGRERRDRYDRHLAFYRGQQWLPEDRGQHPRPLTLNYARTVVDKVTAAVMTGRHIAVDPTGDDPASSRFARQAETALEDLHRRCGLDLLDWETELDAAILGDGCYKVWWDAAAPPGQQLRVGAPDPLGIHAWWDPADFGTVTRVAQRSRLPAADAARRFGIAPAGPEVDVVEDWTADGWALWLDGVLHQTGPNPYGLVPYVLFPNLREPRDFWGVSDLVALEAPARELNRALTTLARILELSGNPIAVLENVDAAEGIAIAPGAIWELPEHAKAYLLDLLSGGSVGLHLQYVDLLYRTLHDLAETPRTAFGENRQALSGVALAMELQPLLQKVERKRLIRTAVYRRRAELALRVLGRMGGEEWAWAKAPALPVAVRVAWGPVLPADRTRQVTDEIALVQAGLQSRHRAMDSLGIADPAGELARIAAEG